jgi:hypothetical protein
VEAVSPLAFVRADLIKYKELRVNAAQVFGTTPDYEPVHNMFVERGRFFNESETARAAQVAVIGPDIVDAVFPGLDPIDKELSIDGRKFRVIGVTERQGKFLFFSRDNVVLVPVKSLPSSNFMGLEGYVADVKPPRRNACCRPRNRSGKPCAASAGCDSSPRTPSRSSPRMPSPTSTTRSRAASTWS